MTEGLKDRMTLQDKANKYAGKYADGVGANLSETLKVESWKPVNRRLSSMIYPELVLAYLAGALENRENPVPEK